MPRTDATSARRSSSAKALRRRQPSWRCRVPRTQCGRPNIGHQVDQTGKAPEKAAKPAEGSFRPRPVTIATTEFKGDKAKEIKVDTQADITLLNDPKFFAESILSLGAIGGAVDGMFMEGMGVCVADREHRHGDPHPRLPVHQVVALRHRDQRHPDYIQTKAVIDDFNNNAQVHRWGLHQVRWRLLQLLCHCNGDSKPEYNPTIMEVPRHPDVAASSRASTLATSPPDVPVRVPPARLQGRRL